MRPKGIREIMGSGRSIAARRSGVTPPDQDKCHGRQWALGGVTGVWGFLGTVCQFYIASSRVCKPKNLRCYSPSAFYLIF